MRKREFFSDIYKKFKTDGITLEAATTKNLDVAGDFIIRQNTFIMAILALLMLAVDTFWLVLSLFIHFEFFNFPYSIGYVIGIAVPLAIIFFVRYGKMDAKRQRVLTLLFHSGIILSVLLFNPVWRSSVMDAHGIGIPVLWLIACAFITLPSITDSFVMMSLLVISTIIPKFVAPNSGYSLIGNLVIAICAVTAYFGFRANTFRCARLVGRLADTSYLDFQTKVLNRKALNEYLTSIGNREISNIGVMMYDIDDFKKYNDEYSHKKGDEILSTIAEAASGFLSDENAKVFRYNGGEFVAIMENVTEERLLKTAIKVKDIVENLHIERKDDSIRPYVTITIGCTLADKENAINGDVIGEADTQLFIGKRGAKNCVVFKGRIFVAEGEISMAQQPTHYTECVAKAISEAISKKELRAFYQPLFETTTHRLVGAEALSRWVKQDGTVILPAEFIPELEKDSSILAIDWYMFEEVCQMLKRQKTMGVPQVRISVNFSRMHVLYERSIEKRLCEIADSYGVPHDLIEIEITESAYIHLPNIIEPFVRNIRAQGFAIAVDDFGSGASSLEFIKSVDVDTLKIDKSLINSNCTDEKERVLLESVVFLAHRLQLNSVAEGVETMEQMGFLKTLGVNQIQGFLFSMPLSEDDFIAACGKEAGILTEAPSNENLSRPSTVQMLMDTVFKEYPVVLMSNLTRNSYYTMTYESFTDFNYTRAGALTDLMDEICSTLDPAEIESFRSTFDLANQFKCYERGDEKISFTCRIHGKDDTNYKKIDTTSYFIKEKGNDDLLVITLCSGRLM